MSTLQGQLLVATRELIDPNFMQSVVLMVQHDEDGAIGLVLNRPLPAKLSVVWKKIGHGKCDAKGVLYKGGPCEGPLMALHNDERFAEHEILSGLYYSTAREEIDQLVQEPPSGLKIFAGYSGWSASQLDGELREGSWAVVPATMQSAFADDEVIWQDTMRRIAGDAMLKTLKIKRAPDDLRMN